MAKRKSVGPNDAAYCLLESVLVGQECLTQRLWYAQGVRDALQMKKQREQQFMALPEIPGSRVVRSVVHVEWMGDA